MKSFVLWCTSIAVAIALVITAMPKATTTFAAAGDITGAAWSSNIGWINMKGSNYAVTMATTGTVRNLSGYAWSSNIGWVSFNGADTAGCPTGTANCQARVEWGTTGGTGVLVKGWARACSVFAAGCSGALKPQADLGGWDGFISLGDSKTTDSVSFGVKLNTTTGVATGYAWGSEVVGWVDFGGVKFDVPPPPPEICNNNIDDNGNGQVDEGCLVPVEICGNGIDDDTDGLIDEGCGGSNNNGGGGNNGGSGEICGNNIDDNGNGLTDEGCDVGPGGICSNIPNEIEAGIPITDPESFTPPLGKYRKVANSNTTPQTYRCLCIAGYVLDPLTYQCKKPVYTEH